MTDSLASPCDRSHSSRFKTHETKLRFAEVVPRVSQAPGFVTGHWTRKDSNGLTMVIFESEDAAKQVSERIQQNMPAPVTLDGVEIREVAAHA